MVGSERKGRLRREGAVSASCPPARQGPAGAGEGLHLRTVALMVGSERAWHAGHAGLAPSLPTPVRSTA